MTVDLVNDVLLLAIWTRKPGRGLIWHTDRGSQYAAGSHRELLSEHGIIQRLSRKGNCWEREACPWGIMPLQKVFLYTENWPSKSQAVSNKKRNTGRYF